jgi:LuxR family maltose regulon positive regulatory protein
MSTPLLTTKLYIPPVRSELVSRLRLTERLVSGLARTLTLVSAPAGFGKTTLLSECAASCRQPVAWVSLDEGDNDPVRFWSYFSAALETIPGLREAGIAEAVGAIFSGPGIGGVGTPLPIEAVLTGLINQLAEVGERFVLVLDDYHLIAEPQIHDGLVFLLDHAPPAPQGMHLILSSRSDPPWPLARLRARGEITELRVGDLRFTVEEAATFLNDVMGFGLTAEAISALDARTEGWIAGLQMAAVSMRERTRADQTGGMLSEDANLTAFIEALSGSHRFILDYLVEEVLDQQTPATQDFLLKTSILERLTAPLCDAVIGGEPLTDAGAPSPTVERPPSPSHALLARLDRANLFLNPLDDERRWYRYHHLFADLLRSRLEQTLPGQISDLHRRASAWYEQQGLIAEALGHALTAGDVERAARLVEGNALATIYHGQLATVAGWFEALPDETVRARPWLCISQAWLLASAGQWDQVESLVQDAERGAHPGATGGKAEALRLQGYISGIRTYAAAIRADLARTQELAHQTLELLPVEDLALRNFVATLLGSALRHSGELAAAARVWTQAEAASRTAGDRISSLILLAQLASLQIEQGQLSQAAALCQEVFRLADESARWGGRRLPIIAPAHARMSTLFREWNDLEGALHHAHECLRLSEPWGHAEAVTTGYMTLAQALQEIGDTAGAIEAMQKARQTASSLSPWYGARLAAEGTRLRLAQGDLAAASRWLAESGLAVDDEPEFERWPAYVTVTRVLIAQGEFAPALDLLARLLDMFETAGAMGSVIEVLVLQAIAFQAQGETAQALDALERALSLAEPEGYVRTFIAEGAPMAGLLRQAAARRIAPAYVEKLLAELPDAEPQAVPQSEIQIQKSEIVEPLTARELEVLRLLTTSLSVPEIADELYISPHTARSHIKNVYGKLDVHNRIEAVVRAQELGLM